MCRSQLNRRLQSLEVTPCVESTFHESPFQSPRCEGWVDKIVPWSGRAWWGTHLLACGSHFFLEGLNRVERNGQRTSDPRGDRAWFESGLFRSQRQETRFPTESDKFFQDPVIHFNRFFHATIVSTFGSHLQNFDSSVESDAEPTVSGFPHQRFLTNQ